jgi:hypothetical protein
MSSAYCPERKYSLSFGDANKHCKIEFMKQVLPILGKPPIFELYLGLSSFDSISDVPIIWAG